MERYHARRALARELLQEAGTTPSCSSTLWDAVMSVSGATIWQQGLRNSGLSLILHNSSTEGVVMVVEDDGLLGCNASSIYDETKWPYDECAQTSRQWLETFGTPLGSSLLMYHWIPGASVGDDGGIQKGQAAEGGFDTLLDVAFVLATPQHRFLVTWRPRKDALGDIKMQVSCRSWGCVTRLVVVFTF